MNSHVRQLVVGRSVIIPMLASEHLFAHTSDPIRNCVIDLQFDSKDSSQEKKQNLFLSLIFFVFNVCKNSMLLLHRCYF